MKLKYLILSMALLSAETVYAKSETFLFGQQDSPHIVVNNRVLVKVNGKAISVVDLMKKMDMMFYRQFPQYSTSVQARYQFYSANWQHVLDDLIDKELILADAEEIKLPVNSGDVRQEMESMFGPNIIANLDKAGLSYDEAYKMVQGDITLRRVLMYRVNSKAIREVTPQTIRAAYDQLAKENIRSDLWRYHVISIRHQDSVKGSEAAQAVYQFLANDSVPLDQLSTKLKNYPNIDPMTFINISDEYKHDEKEISETNKEILSKLKTDTYSQPIAQKSRNDSSIVYRIFLLKAMVKGGIVPFNEVENQIKDKLIDIAIAKETEAYLNRLRKHFAVHESDLKEMAKDDFQPFVLK